MELRTAGTLEMGAPQEVSMSGLIVVVLMAAALGVAFGFGTRFVFTHWK